MKPYITVKDTNGTDYRKIAKDVTDLGIKMNYATVRNVIFEGLYKIAYDLIIHVRKEEPTQEKVSEILSSQIFHEALPDYLYSIYQETLNNKKSVLIENNIFKNNSITPATLEESTTHANI